MYSELAVSLRSLGRTVSFKYAAPMQKSCLGRQCRICMVVDRPGHARREDGGVEIWLAGAELREMQSFGLLS